MVTHYDQLPQALQLATIKKPTWVAGKLLASRFVARDPLTSRAYFDTVDLTPAFEPIKAAERRRMRRTGKDFLVTINADMLRVKSLAAVHSLTPPTGGGKRGKIVGFSRASRKRLIEFMASARTDGQLLFLTLTYPDDFPFGDPETWNAHMEAFRRRFERRYGDYAALWREELKARKSGENQGKVAPHFHMMIDTGIPGTPDIAVEKVDSYGGLVDKTTSPLSKEFEAWALQAWSEIVGSNDERHAQRGAFAVAVRNRRHAYKYISKYVAKEENDDYAVGRRWGTIGTWDTASSRTVLITKKELIELRRLVRSWLRKRGRNSYWKSLRRGKASDGFTVFGLGDGLLSADDEADLSRLVYRMLFHASELASELPLFNIEPLAQEKDHALPELWE